MFMHRPYVHWMEKQNRFIYRIFKPKNTINRKIKNNLNKHGTTDI